MRLNLGWFMACALVLSGCGLDSPGGRIGWLVLLPLGLIAFLLWYVLRWPRHPFYDKDQRRRPDHDDD